MLGHQNKIGFLEIVVVIAGLAAFIEFDDEEIELARSAAGPGAIVFIEWPDALDGVFEEPAVVVRLEHSGGDSRVVSIDVSDNAQETAIRSALQKEGLT